MPNSNETPHENAKRTYRVLAVDHEQGMLTLYNDILCLEGAEPSALEAVLSATDAQPQEQHADVAPPNFDLTLCRRGEEALLMVRKALKSGRPYSVALIDVRLGNQGLEGIWTAENIRDLDPDVEIVMVSGGVDVTLGELNRRIPPPEKLLYLQKPFRPQELKQLALSLCSKWSTETRLRDLNERMAQLVEERTRELNEANQQLERDLDERLLMLKEIWASEERYRLLFEEDITGNFVADVDGNIIACNDSFVRIFGYSTVQEAQQFNVMNLETESGPMLSLIQSLKSHRQIENFEAVFKSRSMDAVHVIGNFVGVFDDGGELTEIRGYFFDITERKKLEEQLRLAQKMEALGTLAGGIAHDFNNILGVIMGYTEIVLEGSDKESRTYRRLREVVNAGARGRDLVRQILNFSRQGAQDLKPLRITPLLKETIKFIRSSIPADIAIRQHILTEEDMVTADPTQMHQILLNLTTNAVHAMRQGGGELSVALDEVIVDEEGAAQLPDLTPGRYVRLSVGDTGHGMDRETKTRIFDPFFTTKGPGEGTGMGLAVVHGVVKRHQGAVMVHSEPGQGITFHVYLPKAGAMVDSRRQEEPEPFTGSGKVLFVDDEKTLVDIGVELLESLGFKAVGRTSSVEALEAFRHNPGDFDLVITDQSMPNLTGADMSKAMLELRPNTPIILCTGFSETVSYETAKAMGIRDFLMKPILKSQLAERIRRVIGDGPGEEG